MLIIGTGTLAVFQTSCYWFRIQAKTVDENGDLLPVGVPGELWTRGYTTMLGYWGDRDHTAEVIRQDRWYMSGYVHYV